MGRTNATLINMVQLPPEQEAGALLIMGEEWEPQTGTEKMQWVLPGKQALRTRQ
jgi:hypothetical protein